MNGPEILQKSDDFSAVVDMIMAKYGRTGSGRASALRLIGAYLIFKNEGPGGFRQRGFNRMSLQLYREKLRDANINVD